MGLDLNKTTDQKWDQTIFNQPQWPKFRWKPKFLAQDLTLLAEEEKLLSNKLLYIDDAPLDELYKICLYEELVNSFCLDDEFIDPALVKSALSQKSLAAAPASPKNLNYGFGAGHLELINNYINLGLDARANPEKRLSKRRLERWSRALAQPGSLAGLGSWRAPSFGLKVSRPGSRPYSLTASPAPEATKIPAEMGRFINWHNAPWPSDLVLKAGIAHLWLLIIQPFLVGSGRVARLATDLALSSRGRICGFYSLSRAILLDRENYHEILSATIEKPDLDITAFLSFFTRMVLKSAQVANSRLDLIINKTARWAKTKQRALTKDQQNVLASLWQDVGPLTPYGSPQTWPQAAHNSNDRLQAPWI
ncbi:MAG: DUF4172 domain-containing protein [Deltaproteobacteria bacterium]|jgi:hypothetical protein|nr:DUF4172 domain-containing protein [Deltaproteobacteria bacterium]